MAITNCTLANATGGTDVVFANVGGSAIGSDVAEFFITANSGFTVRAANFVNNTGSQSWLTSITLTDTDTNLTSLSNYSSNGDVLFPHATTANTVKVTVTLNTSFTMPTSDTTLIFDIDDAAGENGGAQEGSRIELNVDAIYDVVTNQTVTTTAATGFTESSSTASSVTTDNYRDHILADTDTTVFTATFAADGGRYYLNPPVPVISAGSLASRYTLTKTDTTNAAGQITQRVWVCVYNGDTDVTTNDNHDITFVGFGGEAVTISTSSAFDKGATIDQMFIRPENTIINSSGETKTVVVRGTPTTGKYTLTVTKFGEISATSVTDTTYDFSSDTFTSGSTNTGTITLGSTGEQTHDIVFPSVSANDSYGITIAGVDTTIAGTVPSATSYAGGSPRIIIKQFTSNVSVNLGVVSTTFGPGGSGETRLNTLPSGVTLQDVPTRNQKQFEEQEGSGKAIVRTSANQVSFSFVVDTISDFVYPAVNAISFSDANLADETAINPDSNGGTSLRLSGLKATRTSNTRMTYTGRLEVDNFGDTDVDINFNLESIITPDN
jgi:hypothetical protein|tara:strand:- start:1021 stop:2676 length:1656 start_codon:yes stop_codon:yes gene_type:complete